MPTIRRVETEEPDGLRQIVLEVRADTAAEAVSMFHTLRSLEAGVIAGAAIVAAMEDEE